MPPGSCLPVAPVCGWGQYIETFCHSIVLLQACLWWRALNHVYNCTGSKRGQQHNWRGKLAAAPLCGKHHHTPRNQNKNTEGKKLQGLRKLLFFPHSILPRYILQKTFPQHNRSISQKVPWQNNGPFRKLTTDITFISAAFKNILYSVKNIFQAMKRLTFTKTALWLQNAFFSVSHWQGEWVQP